jgi:serine palmitoyltransferase
MDSQDLQSWLLPYVIEIQDVFQKIPGSAILLRYVKSSYQNDPVRSLIELFLCLFAVRYLLARAYSPQKKSYVTLSEEVGLPKKSALRQAHTFLGNRRAR